MRTTSSMIISFKDRETEKIFNRQISHKRPERIQRRVYSKLIQIDLAQNLVDLQSLPGNRLERMKGDRAGQYSIRVNLQWRICFYWEDGDAYEVELVDYH